MELIQPGDTETQHPPALGGLLCNFGRLEKHLPSGGEIEHRKREPGGEKRDHW